MVKNINNKPVTPQAVQQPRIQQEFTPQIGRTERPISQRTQVNNVYLDSVRATQTSQAIPVPSGPGEQIQVSGFTYNITGEYLFNDTSNAITIPLGGTYMITTAIIINDAFGDAGLTIQELQKNGSFLYQNGATTLSYYNSLEATYVGNFNTGDVITLLLTMDEEINPRTMNCSISVIKLS